MPAETRLKVVLCWHMHQPQYRDQLSDVYHLPWTYLHAIKDYVDMAAHLEAVPGARAVVNFAPLLLEQIEDYARQVDGFLNNSLAIRDPLLAALVSPACSSSICLRVKTWFHQDFDINPEQFTLWTEFKLQPRAIHP